MAISQYQPLAHHQSKQNEAQNEISTNITTKES